MRITLVRHGESEGNIGIHDYNVAGDHRVNLTALGQQQALAAGERLRERLSVANTDALVYCSPYTRTRQTLEGIFNGANLQVGLRPRVFEDPRLRETDHGYTGKEEQEALRHVHGFFYYRFNGGESPADNYDRISTFLESMMRQVARKSADDVVIVTHGLAIRCFAMRFLHLSVEQFEALANPLNCDIVTIARRESLTDPMFVSGRWGVEGLRLRPDTAPTKA